MKKRSEFRKPFANGLPFFVLLSAVSVLAWSLAGGGMVWLSKGGGADANSLDRLLFWLMG